MEWSPDGEYFATAGKVKDQTIHKQEKTKELEIFLTHSHFQIFHL